MIKRKRLDRDIWTTITQRRYIQHRIKDEGFSGIAGLLYLDHVSSDSIWQSPCGPVTVCASGMRWLHLLPDGGRYLLTAMFGVDGAINAHYIDLIGGSGQAEDGVYYYDDLLLDLVVYSNGDVLINDREELLSALRDGEITGAQYEAVLRTQNELLCGLLCDVWELERYCRRYLTIIEDTSSYDR